MENFKNNYQLLIEKLDAFIRKYYVNQTLRGGLYFIGLTLALFLGLNFAENLFYFPTGVRKMLFWSFVGVSGVSFFGWIVAPVLHYFRLGKTISHDQAAQIVGDHFPAVKDKLLNVLQLRRQVEHDVASRDLIMASIQQKSEDIKPVPFQSAINLYQNKKYLRYALPPLALLMFMLLAAPSLIKDGFHRLFNYNQEFERAAPFHFSLDKNTLKVVQFQDFDLQVKVDGTVLPNDVFLNINGYDYRMTKIDATTFGYHFSNVQQDLPFKVFAGSIATPQYKLEVLKKMNLAGFEVQLNYPDYTGRPDETLQSVGDLVIPQGTVITWLFNAQNTDEMKMAFANNTPQTIARQGENRFYFSTKAQNDAVYKVFYANQVIQKPDSVAYSMTVLPDLYPTISVEKFDDSTKKITNRLFFAGDAGDDYGLQKLTFNYQIKRKSGAQEAAASEPLPAPAAKQVQYQYTFFLDKLNLQAGDEVTYYFEAFDNDAVHGSKSAKTQTFVFAKPTEAQVDKQIAKNNEEIKSDLKKAIEESKKIQQDVQKLREKLLQQKDVDFNTKKEAEKLVKREQELQKQIKEAKQNFEENKEQQKELGREAEKTEEILKKEEQLQKMFEELQNPEMKELLKQIEEMLQQLNKDQALDKMEQMQLSNEEMKKDLDKMEEMFKQLEVETEMQQNLEKLEEMAKQEEQLSKETEEKKDNKSDAKQKQQDLKKQFKEWKEKKKSTEEKNKKLARPQDTPDTKQEEQETEQEMKESEDALEQEDNAKAAKKQKSAANKMKNMANKTKQKQAQQQQEQEEEDLKAMRQLLENLVNLSFDQEGLIAETGKTVENTPRWVKMVQQQKKLRDDFSMIEDSLQALSKRQAAIQTFVTEKVTDVKEEMRLALKLLEDRRKFEGADHQQRTMKNVNDLALMLAESMNQMQQQMANKKPGSSNCKNPGKGAPKPGSGAKPSDKMGEGQKSVNDGLKEMRDRMKNGKGSGNSQEFAKMAAKQAALRNALRQKQKELQQKGKGDKGLQEMIDGMDKTETELVNKQLTEQTIRRNEDILTRLLENEKAERERGEDEQRKAETVKQQQQNALPPNLQEYLKKRQAETELYRTVSPSLRPYYKGLVEEYQKSLRGGSPK
ncbi:MAG: hypothetical protein RL757_2746 [Bacteroidota bacterium]|jgi:hypothetical protein